MHEIPLILPQQKYNFLPNLLVCSNPRTKFIDILVQGLLGTFKGVYNRFGCDLDLSSFKTFGTKLMNIVFTQRSVYATSYKLH